LVPEIAGLFTSCDVRSSLAVSGQCGAEQAQTYQCERCWFGNLGRTAIGRTHDAAGEFTGVALGSNALKLGGIRACERNPIREEVACGFQCQRKSLRLPNANALVAPAGAAVAIPDAQVYGLEIREVGIACGIPAPAG